MILKFFTLNKKDDQVLEEGQEEYPDIEVSDVTELFEDNEKIIVDEDDEYKTILLRPNV